MEKVESMKDKALNKIEAKIKFLLLEIRALQDEITGKRIKPMGITNAQILDVISFKNRELEVLTYIKTKIEL